MLQANGFLQANAPSLLGEGSLPWVEGQQEIGRATCRWIYEATKGSAWLHTDAGGP